MNTVERTSPRSARLDRARPSSRVRGVSTDERFRGQDWKKLQAKLTTFAHHRTRRRSWELAQDLAQTAIADVITRPETWDPEKEPLLKHLAKRVIGLASNEWSRKKTTLEVLFAPTEEEDAPDMEYEQDELEDVFDRRRVAARFRARLDEEVAGDEDAVVVVTQMAEGRDTPASIAKASRLPIERVREARRRVFYHAKAVTQEMDVELDAADDARMGDAESMEEEEVDQ
jgi:hypothetical protein